MIEIVEKQRLVSCDLCGRRLINYSIKSNTCIKCNKDICGYCKVILTRRYRKYIDSGYSQIIKQIGVICLNCINRKLKLKLEKLNYPGGRK